MPIDCSTMAVSPAVTCSPEATTASYSRASCSIEASRTQATSWLVAPAMADTTTATLLPASTSRLTWLATLRMRSTLATEVPPNFITTTAIPTLAWASDVGWDDPRTRVLLPAGPFTRNCGRKSGHLHCSRLNPARATQLQHQKSSCPEFRVADVRAGAYAHSGRFRSRCEREIRRFQGGARRFGVSLSVPNPPR